jgi:hypothetical protein
LLKLLIVIGKVAFEVYAETVPKVTTGAFWAPRLMEKQKNNIEIKTGRSFIF